MDQYQIPFNKPSLSGNEFRYMVEAIERGHISGDGEFTRRCEALLEEQLGVRRALLTTSCTHALEMAALLLPAPTTVARYWPLPSVITWPPLVRARVALRSSVRL